MANGDYDEFINQQATRAAGARHNHETYNERKRVRKLLLFGGRKQRKARTCPMMVDKNGEVITGVAAKHKEAAHHSGDIEAAAFMTKTDITEQHSNANDICDSTTVRSIDNVASIFELEEPLARRKLGRAAGPDEVTDDLAHAAP
eukprot:1717542-Pyramimonas_sp.AAC.1